MSELSLNAPENAWFLLLAPLLVFLAWSVRRAKQSDLARLVSARVFPLLWQGLPPASLRPVIALGVVGTLLGLALLRPTFGYRLESYETQASEIVIALDVSESMRSADISPSRLAHTRRKASDLIGRMQGERIGLVFFSGMVSLESPLTEDTELLLERLKRAEEAKLLIPGSRFDMAIRESLRLLAADSDAEPESATVPVAASKAIVLLSDGDGDGESARAAAEEARRRGVGLYVLGVGTPEGAPVPFETGRQGYRKLPDGNLLMSRLEENLLSELAERGGGRYVRSRSSDEDLRMLYDRGLLVDLGKEAGQTRQERRPTEIFQIPLALALFVLLYDSFFDFGFPRIGLWLRRRKKRSLAKGRQSPSLTPSQNASLHKAHHQASKGALWVFALLCPLSLLFWPSSLAHAADFLNRRHEEGKAAYEKGDFETAARIWKDRLASSGKEAAPEDYYNLGSALYRLGDYKGAAEAYDQALGRLGETGPTLAPEEAGKKGVPPSAPPSNPDFEADLLHNRGNAEFLAGDLQKAVESYLSSLGKRPDDRATQANLQRAQQLLEMQQQQKSSEGGDARETGDESRSQERSQGQRGQQGQAESSPSLGSQAANPSGDEKEWASDSQSQASSSSQGESSPDSDEKQSAGDPSQDGRQPEGEEDKDGDPQNGGAKGDESQDGAQSKDSSEPGTEGQSSQGRDGNEGESDESQEGSLSASELDKALKGVKESDARYRKWRLEKEAQEQLERYGRPEQGGQDW